MKTDVLPGWIVGTAGAVRYRLPADQGSATIAKTDVYGYLLATVNPDGEITFNCKEIQESATPDWVKQRYAEGDIVHQGLA